LLIGNVVTPLKIPRTGICLAAAGRCAGEQSRRGPDSRTVMPADCGTGNSTNCGGDNGGRDGLIVDPLLSGTDGLLRVLAAHLLIDLELL
jgi:hypothetical protein